MKARDRVKSAIVSKSHSDYYSAASTVHSQLSEAQKKSPLCIPLYIKKHGNVLRGKKRLIRGFY